MSDGSLLREVPGWRRVMRTRLADRDCVTRVLLSAQVSVGLGPLVEQVVLRGHGTMYGHIPDELLLTLEGYRVAARLPAEDRWTRAVAAGVTPEGNITISTLWIEGTPLHKVPAMPPAEAEAIAIAALDILAGLHERLVAYGDFKNENLVLRPDGSVALIDLDTLREVADPVSYAPTRDITRSWAAPEQEHAQQTYLASDLWAWARLVEYLFPDGAPDAWADALRACRLHDPLFRPRTAALLSHLLHGAPLVDWRDRPTPPEGAPSMGTERVPAIPDATWRVPEHTPTTDATLRVPESGSTPVVVTQESTGSLDRRAPVPAQRKGAGLGCLQWLGILVVLPFLVCGGGLAAWDRVQIHRADAAAEEVLVALKRYKTVPAVNSQRGQRDALLQGAEEAWQIRHTPRSSAIRALATVWAQGWQDARKTWDDQRYADAVSALDAVQGPNQPEALLAKATVDGGVCRLKRLDATSAVQCQRALEELEAFQAALPEAADSHWLRVEGAWTEVLVRSELASQSRAAHLPDASEQLDAGRARCAAAEPWLPYAPVNGVELLQDCLRLAGTADALDQYLHWSDLLVAADQADGEVTNGTLWHLYAGVHEGCETVTVDKKRGDWQVRGTPWCLAVGHAARHCWVSAEYAMRDSDDDPQHPWNTLGAIVAAANPGETCVR